MLTPELQKIREDYQATMLEVGIRLDLARSIHTENISTGFRPVDYETIAMNFRKVAELIVFANLIGHEKEYTAIYDDINKEWNLGRLINKIKKINPDYYPVAWNEELNHENVTVGVVDVPDGEYMTEQELIDMYGSCSDLIHAHNPFKPVLDYDSYSSLFIGWGSKLVELLSVHGVLLADRKHVIMCIMNPRPTPHIPEVHILEADPANGLLKRIR